MSGQRRSRLAAAVLATAAAALLAAGCGSDGGQSATEQWADGVCSAFLDWTQTVSSIGNTLREGDVSTDSVEQAAGDLSDATGQLVDDLQDLGPPDTEAGQQAQESLEELSDQLENDLQEIEDAVEGASGVAGAAEALSAVGTTLTTMGTAVGQTFQALEQLDAQGELEDAFEQSESCTELTEQGS